MCDVKRRRVNTNLKDEMLLDGHVADEEVVLLDVAADGRDVLDGLDKLAVETNVARHTQARLLRAQVDGVEQTRLSSMNWTMNMLKVYAGISYELHNTTYPLPLAPIIASTSPGRAIPSTLMKMTFLTSWSL